MKYIILISLPFIFSLNSLSQEIKRDTRLQILKENYEPFMPDQITSLDFLQALEFAGIRINKFEIGSFDKKYNLNLFIEEFRNGKRTNIDTIFNSDNEYIYFEDGDENYYTDYIDQIKVLTKVIDTTLTLKFFTYGIIFSKSIQFVKSDKEAFYNLRNYLDTKWKLNNKIPLFVFASSWKDKKGGFQRFCGEINLSKNHKDTDELLYLSPHYYLISYEITE